MSRTPARQKTVAPPLGRQAALPAAPVPGGCAPAASHRTLDRRMRAAQARLGAGIWTQSFWEAWLDWGAQVCLSPGRQIELAEQARRSSLALMMQALDVGGTGPPPFAPKGYDPRFSDPGWQKSPFRFWQQGFLALQEWWDLATKPLPGLHPHSADRARFMARQSLDLMSPSNVPWLNPEIIAHTQRRLGRNLAEGAADLAHDIAKTLSQIPDPVPEGYAIGTDIACTPGQVVFRNDLFELIQYAPQTDKVQAEPILIVPAWIMKYYVLDLSPQNSMIRYLVQQGFTVFAISWCNPTAEQAGLSLEDYRKRGVMAALEVIGAIVPQRQVHAVGYCLGGTILAIAAATMARDGDQRLASVTLMAAQVDFAEVGELLLFIDENQVAFLEDLMWDQGYLQRPQMARAFSTIQTEDLIYSRAVRRYYLGTQDVPEDMGVWLADLTRMPARMHSEYLRALLLENRLSAGRFAVEGGVISLQAITAPMFVVATEADHIAPWTSVYKTRLFTDADLTFVLGSGGHNSGIVVPPGAEGPVFRLAHQARGAPYIPPQDWLAQQPVARAGSWWPAWADWLARHSTARMPPPELGAASLGYPPLGAAPGEYIHQS